MARMPSAAADGDDIPALKWQKMLSGEVQNVRKNETVK
jgi:hypothetical protein